MKICSTCKKTLPLDLFYKNRNQCKNCRRLQKIEYRESNKEKVAEQRRNYSVSSNGIEVRSKYRKKTRGYRNHLKAKRRSSLKNATPSWVDLSKIKTVYNKAKWLESLTGLKYHVDHIIPLNGKNVCGLHCWNNLQILEDSINIKKGVLINFI